jgi:cell division transport system ATP-binding protein
MWPQDRLNGNGALGVIELENVSHNYGGGALLSGMSLSLAPGSFHFLTGPSGAGKTTLLRICYGELLPTAGEVRLFQKSLRDMSRDDVAMTRRRIGVVHQDCQFLDHLSVSDNVALPLMAADRDVAAHRAELAELLGDRKSDV